MKKNLSILLSASILIFLITGIGFAFQNEPDGFRGLKWGDAPTEDMVFVGKLNVGEVFYTKIEDKKGIGTAKFHALGYVFYNKRFIQAMGFFKDKNNYNILEIICREKFGEPTKEGYYDLTWYGSKTIIWLRYNTTKDEGSLDFGSIKIKKEQIEDIINKKS